MKLPSEAWVYRVRGERAEALDVVTGKGWTCAIEALPAVAAMLFMPFATAWAQSGPLNAGAAPPHRPQADAPASGDLDEQARAIKKDIQADAPGEVDATAGAAPRSADSGPSTPSARLNYTLTVTGLTEIRLDRRFEALSVLRAKRRSPPETHRQLERRAETDERLLYDLLASEGYYNARVATTVEPIAQEGRPVAVDIAVEPGARFVIVSVDLSSARPLPPEVENEILKDINLDPDAPARAQDVLDADASWRLALLEQGYPFTQFGARDVVVDHAANSMAITFPFDPGARAVFGRVAATGQTSVEGDYIAELAPWKPGERYRESRLQDYRRALVDTGLFQSVAVSVKPGAEPAPPGEATADVDVSVEEAKHRTLAASAGYGSGEGYKLIGRWQHRNLLGRGEQLDVIATGGTREQSIETLFRKPNFTRRERTLNLRLFAGREDLELYKALSGSVGASIEQKWGKRWTASVGTQLEYSRVTDAVGTRRFTILSLPLTASRDTTDTLFDPTRGNRAIVLVTPEAALNGGFVGFTTLETRASLYQRLGGSPRYVAAGRIRLGTIVGARDLSLPATRRFYAGGGGSVRGYGYQSLGGRDVSGDPIGGTSVAEVSAELRAHVFGPVGLVPFIDGGAVSDNRLPSLSRFRWGVGLGLRYYTSFAPVRLDVATPLNRSATDASPVAVYISIGQSF